MERQTSSSSTFREMDSPTPLSLSATPEEPAGRDGFQATIIDILRLTVCMVTDGPDKHDWGWSWGVNKAALDFKSIPQH